MSSDEANGNGAMPAVRYADTSAMLDAWRQSGHHRFDPVRFRFIEALARRAEDRGGDVRRVLDDKLAKLLASYGEALEGAPPAPAEQEMPAGRGPLAELVADIERHASMHEVSTPASDLVPGLPSPQELKALAYFRSTWSRLSAEQRLTQSLEKVPENAGPLNSHHLVHRALTLMQDLSPGYLHRFMSYVDALFWLDQVNDGASSVSPEGARPQRHGRAARGR